MPSRSSLPLRLAALLAVLAAAVALLVWSLGTRDPEQASSAAPEAKTPAGIAAAPEPTIAPQERAREEIDATVPETQAASAEPEEPRGAKAPAPAPLAVAGIVVDVAGDGVAGVKIVVQGGKSVLATSAAGGRFRCEVDREGRTLVTGPGEFATLRGCRIDATGLEGEHVIVVARAIDLAGVVLDESGAAIANAHVFLEVPRGVFTKIEVPLDGSPPVHRMTQESDEAGRFEILGVPAAPGAFLYVTHVGFEPASEDVPDETRRDLVLELRRPDLQDPHLSGIVLHADATPAEDAHVQLGFDSTETDAQGRFRLELQEWTAPETPLVAAKRGFQPALVPEFGAIVEAANRRPAPVRLVLGGPALAIRGRVLREGEPCKGWEVALVDGTEVSRKQIPPVLAEKLSSPRSGRCATDKSGAFALEGLMEREYRLQAWDARSLLLVRSGPIAAGRSDVVLEVPANALREKLRGRVLTPEGAPLENVRAQVRLVTVRKEFGSSWIDGKSALTDAQGRFELSDVPRESVAIEISGETILPTTHDIAPDADDDLELVAALRCHFKIDAAGSDPLPDSAALVDGSGASATVWQFEGKGWSSSDRVRLEEGRSQIHSAAEGAYALVFYREQEETARQHVELRPGDVQTFRP